MFLLEAIFEKTFSDKSHGFQISEGACTVCKNIRMWKGASWFIEGDIVSCFDIINHQKLVKMVSLKIKDQQVVGLL